MNRRRSILFVGDNSCLWYRYGKLYYECFGKKVSCVLQKSFLKRVVSRIRIAERLLRLSPRTSIRIDEKSFLISYNGRIYLWDVLNNILQCDHEFREEMNNPLSFSRIERVDGFDDCIAYGEYFVNPSRKPVSIWIRTRDSVWKSVYQFEGNIIHVHGIVPDSTNGCVYILTGDFNDEAAIWVARNNFEIVYPLHRGEQKYRGCVGFATEKGLLYATDTPTEMNAVFLSEKNGELKKIIDLPGPCIYGTRVKEFFYFATSVEPDSDLPTWKYFLSRKPGPGIIDNYTHVFAGNLEAGFIEVAKFQKDIWPLTLFQFATVLFPDCDREKGVCLMPVAVKKYDNVPVFIES